MMPQVEYKKMIAERNLARTLLADKEAESRAKQRATSLMLNNTRERMLALLNQRRQR